MSEHNAFEHQIKQHPRFAAAQSEQEAAEKLSKKPGDFKFWLDPNHPDKINVTYCLEYFSSTYASFQQQPDQDSKKSEEKLFKTFACELSDIQKHLDGDLSKLELLIVEGLKISVGVDHDLTLTNIHTAYDEAKVPRKENSWAFDFDKILLHKKEAVTVIKALSAKNNCFLSINTGHMDINVVKGTLISLLKTEETAKLNPENWLPKYFPLIINGCDKNSALVITYTNLMQIAQTVLVPTKKTIQDDTKSKSYDLDSYSSDDAIKISSDSEDDNESDLDTTLPKNIPHKENEYIFPLFLLEPALQLQKNKNPNMPLVIDVVSMNLVNDLQTENDLVEKVGAKTFLATQKSPQFWFDLAAACGCDIQPAVEEKKDPIPFDFYKSPKPEPKSKEDSKKPDGSNNMSFNG